MEETKYTPAQQAAIDSRGATLLVSAAAGSGKTFTLTKRIIDRITKDTPPADISRLLIVTFTRAAAADLKTKISKAISDALAKDPTNHRLASQLMLLGSAHISTIDSFYYDILKNNFSKLSLPGNLRIADTAEMTLLCRSVMEDTIDEFYEDADFEDFVDHFADVRSTDRIADIFLGIYEDLLSYREGVDLLSHYEARLTESVDLDFLKTPYGKAALSEITATLTYIKNNLLAAEAYFENDERLSVAYLPAFRHDRLCAEKVLELVDLEKYEEARMALNDHEFLPLKSVKNKDEYTQRLHEMRNKAKDLLKKLKDEFFAFSQEEISEHMVASAHVCHETHRFLSAFDKKLAKEKNTRGICAFSDIRRFVMQLIVDENGEPTPLALDLREQFDEIYIDEYQDTDEVQDLIFRSIAKDNNRFMVGDIKQSIYSFRGAEPSIFAGYKRTMPPLGGKGNQFSIFMSNNFRCDENIIRFSNLVSSYLFRNCGESIEYSKEDDLIFSKKKPSEDYVSPKVVLAITGLKQDKTEDEEEQKKPRENAEAIYIVNEIGRLLREEKKADGSPITPGDIAILMRGKRDMAELIEMLQVSGIPACNTEENNFFENPDVLLVLSLLSTIDNPQKDVSLAGALCSPFYGFTLEDLVILRKYGTHAVSLYDAVKAYADAEEDALAVKCREFLVSLSYWRNQARALPVDKLLRKLYREWAILSMQNAEESNLLRLYEYARGFESGSFRGLYGFIRYINEIIESGTKLSDSSGSASVDAVQLMTIHHSKGLEFPVCFIYGTSKSFNNTFKREKIQFEPSVGIGFYLHDQSGLGYYDTTIRQAVINQKSRLGREEEMRILYVAMTRARERLYVTAQTKKYDAKWEDAQNLAEFGKAFGIIKANSYLDWILAAIAEAGERSPLTDCLTVKLIHEGELTVSPHAWKPHAPVCANDDGTQIDEGILKMLETRFSFAYPFEHISDLPAKLSVSKLYPAALDEEDETVIPDNVEDADFDALLDEQFRLPARLVTDHKITAAERGTATHTFLQFCDFDHVTRFGVREELARLSALRFITPEMAETVNVKQLEDFFAGELFARIKKARRVWREQRFNLFLPAADFTENKEKAALLEGETIAVQGVIDLFFEDEDGNIVLCDYKTDYLTREELAEPPLAADKLEKRHGLQLSYYAKALEAMMGRAPSEVLIYSLPLADSVKVSFPK